MPSAIVLDDELAAGVRGRQRHSQRAYHRVVLLGVGVRDEELPGSVHQQCVQFGLQPVSRGNPELVRQFCQRPLQGLCP